MVLPGSPLQVAQEVALHGGGANPSAPAKAATVDAVQVLLEDHCLEALAGSLEGLNPWNALAKPAAAIQTAALAQFETQHALAKTPVIMPNRPPAPALVPQTGTMAVGARYRPAIPGRYRDQAPAPFDRGNLVLGQPQNDLRIGQTKSPKIVLPTWD